MAFPPDFIHELKSIVNIEELIGEYVKLERSGTRLRALCPFHSEKTPSFYVNPDSGLFHCFGCKASGDVISFVERIENLDFNEAVKFLAEKYNIPLRYSSSGYDKSEKDAIFEVLDQAQKFFRENLKKNTKPFNYLLNRGLNEETIEFLKLGYSPSSGLVEFLRSKGFEIDEIKKAGLVTESGVERFKNRVIFPIFNLFDRVIGFGGRIVESRSDAPKYLNSPSTLVFEKKNVLYGLNFTKGFVRKRDFIILVEGYMDFASLFQNGVFEVAAALGTAFTENHARLIRRFASKVFLSFDSDDAGLKAAIRSFEILANQGLFVYAIDMPEGEDPDTFVSKYGKESFYILLDNAVEIPLFLTKHVVEKKGFSSMPLKDKLEAVRMILESVSKVEDRVRKGYYIREISVLLDIPEKNLLAELGGIEKKDKQHFRPASFTTKADLFSQEEKALLCLIAFNPEEKRRVNSMLEGYVEILPCFPYYSILMERDYQVIGHIAHELPEELNQIIASVDSVTGEVERIVKEIKRLSLKKRIGLINEKLKVYADSLTDEERDKLLREKFALQKEIYRL